jgi:hypothetical protein
MNIESILLSTTILTIISLYPFYLKKYKPHKYKGLWQTLGDLNQTPKRAILYPLGWLIGGLFYIIFVQ